MVDGIATTSTVIAAVAKNLGKSEKRVESVYNSMVDYLKYLIDYTDVTTIQIPHLGRLHFKYRHFGRLKKDLQKLTDNEANRLKLEMLEKKKQIITEFVDDYGKKRHNKKLCKHIQKENIYSYGLSSGYNLAEIQEAQNEGKE